MSEWLAWIAAGAALIVLAGGIRVAAWLRAMDYEDWIALLAAWGAINLVLLLAGWLSSLRRETRGTVRRQWNDAP